ncbi:MAG: IreB family regulatory phosphoprotein [Lachnospiraceae bacterium]|nr:IreB family regulatory phosphoprotein [Lachnospiraceae bacterium]
MANDNTVIIPINDRENVDVKKVLKVVLDAMNEKAYNPVNQLVGFIMSGDPTYITAHKNARSMIMKVERDEILEELVNCYIKNNK